MTLYNFDKKIISFFFLLSSLFLYTSQAFAQAGGVASGEILSTNPKIRDAIITATVPDIVPPSAPILISPGNGALLNDATPTFIWQESTDNVGISYYQLYLDGAILYNTLVYDSGSGQYSLTPTATISDGSHTWSVFVFDAAGNNNTSATWSFNIDTLAPSFIITSIGPITATISAQDIGSIPVDPIELEDNSPLFIGTGEKNSTVKVTVAIPGETDQIINFTVDGSSNWNFQLDILPRDEVITLNFVITDLVGNISILTNLKILIIQDYIIYPPTPTPGTSPIPTPPTSPPTPIIKIPILPLKEIIDRIYKEIKKILPESIIIIISQTPELIQATILKIIESMGPTGTLVATSVIPIFSFLALLLQLGQQFSWQLILKILQALGLLPPKEPQGIVYDSDTNAPIAFALLTITSAETNLNQQIIATLITDVDGIYQGTQLPKGKYIISVSHQDYKFPTNKQRPTYLTVKEFYRGEIFEVVSSDSQQLFLIPVDKLTETHESRSFKKTLRRIVQKVKFINLFWPLLTISVIITIFYPTVINLVVLMFYAFILLKKALKSLKKPSISGYVVNTNKSPIENAIVRINDPEKGRLMALLTTNSKGYFSAYLQPSRYQIQVSKNGFIWMRKGSSLSLEEIDVTQAKVSLRIEMKDVNEIYKEMLK
ncbi:carboxypeptidase regulatory-like domain-containing protein [Patescibacteria group bacterium]|nr:carboxypeptidase regulatory-like domain-containing protein [Patescibacteria group bacterium]